MDEIVLYIFMKHPAEKFRKFRFEDLRRKRFFLNNEKKVFCFFLSSRLWAMLEINSLPGALQALDKEKIL